MTAAPLGCVCLGGLFSKLSCLFMHFVDSSIKVKTLLVHALLSTEADRIVCIDCSQKGGR